MATKALRAPDDVEGAYRLVIAPGYGEEGCELLVFGRGKRGAFHLRGAHTGIPVRDARDVPLKKGQWRAIVDYVEAKRLWDVPGDDANRAVVMDGVCHSFEAIGPELHAFEVTFGSVPDAQRRRVWRSRPLTHWMAHAERRADPEFRAGSAFASSRRAVSPHRSLIVGLFLVIPAAASAETNAASAHSLFLDARAAIDRGAYEEACPKLEESMRLEAAVGTQLNLADCYEHVGKIASAWAGFLDAASMAKASRQLEREKLARARAKALEPRVPKLVIDADLSSEPGLEVLRDGVSVGSATWATPIAVDPGSHDVVASAPGKMSWRAVVDVKEGQTTRVAVPKKLFVRIERRVAAR